jgi:tRNA dimethylallyltransferase
MRLPRSLIFARAGKTPILVGGTGLYFKALTQGLAEMPASIPNLRAALRERAGA